MAGIPRPASAATGKKNPGQMRPPITRPHTMKTPSNIISSTACGRSESRTGSPTGSDGSRTTAPRLRSPTSQSAGIKRKDRDYEHEPAEESSIRVVVRCRGRSEREIRENSGVVLSTDGPKGRSVELSMGPAALSNKTYHFDRVFSPAADQSMICEEVVTPLLDEASMLLGYNCTIFAYGQTGTGKTYTMSGDMSDTLGLVSDSAGIIPRMLHSLFRKLEDDNCETTVKCSFIELYNEELRDLLSADDNNKLKIYEDSTKKAQGATYVQGMGESYIKSATEGIKLLQGGSHKRQVAATKCNDLSSRSHTIFTVTAYVKRTTESGEDYVSAGKLNLVDLAGSENIQRSGAESKRAAEAGLINKSLLTLGRVINALVDRSSHIPYRESKLTRLLQDSLGGHTKTCIIATVSSAKSNLDETISTLDYAFRAKNIRNKPQVNQLISKRTLLREFTAEIEKLKSELVAARQKNGVYLTGEAYNNIISESESRRILSEEQKAKIEAIEATLRSRVQELFLLTTNFNSLKKENDTAKATLDETNGLLERTEFVLSNTKRNLAEESLLRKAHETTEGKLNEVGGQLLSALGKTVADVDGLRSKLRRTSDLHARNRSSWAVSQKQVSDVARTVESRIEDLENEHQRQANMLSEKVGSFVEEQLQKLEEGQRDLRDGEATLEDTCAQLTKETRNSKDGMDQTLGEIKIIREDIKHKVGQALSELSSAAARISAGVVDELGRFHTQLHTSYSSLGKDFKAMFEDLLYHLDSQKAEVAGLRQGFLLASTTAVEAHHIASSRLECVLAEEREQAFTERQNLLARISSLVETSGKAQDARWASKLGALREDIHTSRVALEGAQIKYREGMDAWSIKEGLFVEEACKSREMVKLKLKQDWTDASERNSSVQATTKTIQQETMRVVDSQMQDIDDQTQALDEFVAKAKVQNNGHYGGLTQSLQSLTSSIKQSFNTADDQNQATHKRTQNFGQDLSEHTKALVASLSPLAVDVRQPLVHMRTEIAQTRLEEYAPTGATPQKTQYQYPTILPKTDLHENIIAAHRGRKSPSKPQHSKISPSKKANQIFTDTEDEDEGTVFQHGTDDRQEKSAGSSLREVDINVNAGLLSNDIIPSTLPGSGALAPPPMKRAKTAESRLPHLSGKDGVIKLEGRENSVMPVYVGRPRRGD